MSGTERDDPPTEVFERPPNLLEVKAGWDEVRDEMAANQQVVDEFPRHMRRIATSAGTEAGAAAAKGTSRRYGIAGLIAVVLLSIGISLAGILIAKNASETVAAERVARVASDQRAEADRQRTAENIASLQDANRQLTERGQAPVAAPAPGDTDQAALVAATTAQVLAAMPKYPTLQDLAPVIAAVVASQPMGPTMAQLSTAVADYLRANPAPRGEQGQAGDQGPKGETGDPGRPPTADEIRAAVDAELAANPEKYRGPAGKPPASWTYSDLLGSHTCTRAGGPDDAATYTCD